MVDTSKLSKPASRKGAPPSLADTDYNLEKPPSGQKVPLQLRISSELRRGFKGHANDHDMNANTLFEIVWAYYRDHHG